jgi:hypothetical protein
VTSPRKNTNSSDGTKKENTQHTSSSISTISKGLQPSSVSSHGNYKKEMNPATSKKVDAFNHIKKSDMEITELMLKAKLPNVEKLPKVIVMKNIVAHLGIAELNKLSSLNRSQHGIFNQRLEIAALLRHIAYGNQVEAEKILQQHPEYLMLHGSVKTYAEDTIEDVNPLELAYGEEDDDMFKMMLPYLKRLPQEDQAKLFNQLKERFPETKEEKYNFSPIVAAITSNDKKAIEATLEQFRKDFAPQVIKKGKVITRITQALEQAMQVYIDNYDPWSGDQCSIFWCKAIGYLQRRLSACYAQAHCQGLYNAIDGKQSLARGVTLNGGSLYFSHPLSSRKGLGFDFGLSSCGVGVDGSAGRWGAHLLPRFQNLCRAKTEVFWELMWQSDSRSSKKTLCVIL